MMTCMMSCDIHCNSTRKFAIALQKYLNEILNSVLHAECLCQQHSMAVAMTVYSGVFNTNMTQVHAYTDLGSGWPEGTLMK